MASINYKTKNNDYIYKPSNQTQQTQHNDDIKDDIRAFIGFAALVTITIIGLSILA